MNFREFKLGVRCLALKGELLAYAHREDRVEDVNRLIAEIKDVEEKLIAVGELVARLP